MEIIFLAKILAMTMLMLGNLGDFSYHYCSEPVVELYGKYIIEANITVVQAQIYLDLEQSTQQCMNKYYEANGGRR